MRFYPVGFCSIGLHKKTYPLFRSRSKNVKLGIGSDKNQLKNEKQSKTKKTGPVFFFHIAMKNNHAEKCIWTLKYMAQSFEAKVLRL